MTIIEILIWIIVAGFFAGLETGIYSLNKLRLKLYLENKPNKKIIRVANLLKDIQSLICMTLIGTNIGIHYATSLTTEYIDSFKFNINSEILATLILTPFIFIFGETLPKNIFRILANRIIYEISIIILFFKYLFYPFIIILKWIIQLFSFILKIEKDDKDKSSNYLDRADVLNILLTSKEEGIITPYQNIIAKNIIEIEEIKVEEVMTKWENTYTLPPNFTKEDLIKKTKETGFSRFPVYDKVNNKVIGIANFFDIFYEKKRKSLIRPPIFIPPNFSIKKALKESTYNKQPMLIILNSKKNEPLGIVTIKDIISALISDKSIKNK